ncbi:probable BOI-related E3 ubiquitin-protein ligase 3 [Tanacetum coccineum]
MAVEATHLLPQLLVNNNQIMMMNMESNYTKLSNGSIIYNNVKFGYYTHPHHPLSGYNESLMNNQDDSGLTNSVPVSRKRSRNDNSSYSNSQTITLLGKDIFSQIHHQHLEIDQFAKYHEIKVKRRRTPRTIITALEEGLQHQLRAKEDEITEMMKLNHALQEKVKTMCIENQIWRELAQTNEATANTLRSNLKYLLDYKLGHDVAVEDAESCCESSNDISQHDSTILNLVLADLSSEILINGVVGGLRPDMMCSGSLLKQCAYIMSTEHPSSMYTLLTMYEAITAVMTTRQMMGWRYPMECFAIGHMHSFP